MNIFILALGVILVLYCFWSVEMIFKNGMDGSSSLYDLFMFVVQIIVSLSSGIAGIFFVAASFY